MWVKKSSLRPSHFGTSDLDYRCTNETASRRLSHPSVCRYPGSNVLSPEHKKSDGYRMPLFLRNCSTHARNGIKRQYPHKTHVLPAYEQDTLVAQTSTRKFNTANINYCTVNDKVRLGLTHLSKFRVQSKALSKRNIRDEKKTGHGNYHSPKFATADVTPSSMEAHSLVTGSKPRDPDNGLPRVRMTRWLRVEHGLHGSSFM